MIMEPKIVTREAFTVMGVIVRCNPMDADYSAIWEKQFMPYHDQISPLSTDKAYYWVYFETGEENLADVMAGMAVGEAASPPEGLVVREVPTARYAVFECAMDMETIGETWGRIYSDWLPASRYEHDVSLPSFEYIPPDAERAGGFPVFIHVPVRERRGSMA